MDIEAVSTVFTNLKQALETLYGGELRVVEVPDEGMLRICGTKLGVPPFALVVTRHEESFRVEYSPPEGLAQTASVAFDAPNLVARLFVASGRFIEAWRAAPAWSIAGTPRAEVPSPATPRALATPSR